MIENKTTRKSGICLRLLFQGCMMQNELMVGDVKECKTDSYCFSPYYWYIAPQMEHSFSFLNFT